MSNRDGGGRRSRDDHGGNERRGDRGRGGSPGPQGWNSGRPVDPGSRGRHSGETGRAPFGFQGGGKGRQQGATQERAVYSTRDHSIPSPSTQVTQVEDNFQKALSSGGIQGLQTGANFPCRPGYGTRGEQITLWTNYFEITPSQNLVLYRYNVAVQPAAIGKKLSQIIRLLLSLPEYGNFRDDIVTDFRSTLISRRELSNISSDAAVQYQAEGEDQPRAHAPSYQLRVQKTGTFTASELTTYLNSTNVNTTYADKLPVLQALNIFLGHYARASPTVATIGSRKSFSITHAPHQDLGAGLSATRGFFSSIRVATCRILVNVNVSHGTFYNVMSLDGLIRRYLGNQDNKLKLQSFLKRVRVKVTHLAKKQNKAGEPISRVKTIYGLASKYDGRGLDRPPLVMGFGAGPQDVKFFLNDSTGAPSSSYTDQATGNSSSKYTGKGVAGGASNLSPGQNVSQSGKYISVYEFFKTVHKRRNIDISLPVVNVGSRENPSYLPAEVCEVMRGQNSQSKLDPEQTQKMIKFAVRKPWENANSIAQEGLGTIGLSQQAKVMNPFMLVNPELITVTGRVLQEPQVIYKSNKFPKVQGGTWNMQAMKVNEGGILRNWTYLVIYKGGSSNRGVISEADLKFTVGKFHQALQGMGIIAEPPFAGSTIRVGGPDDIKIEAELRKIASSEKNPARFVLVILPDVESRMYSRVKHAGDVKVGIHTVCVVGSKFAQFDNKQVQKFANVALKFNLKLGGINQLAESTGLGIINEDKTMVVGVDVTHPSPSSASNAPSIAGMVASVDKRLGQWPADLRIQESHKEMVSELDSMFKSRLFLWKSQGKHAEFPENVLIYRDGVSEGQYATILEAELPLLRKACDELYPPPDRKKGLPHITIIIVGKRHHTRFYPTDISKADTPNCNPMCGTVVDRGVTEARNWDFFLQPHKAIQGTARPAHYHVVLDEIFAQRKIPDGLQNVAEVLEDLTLSMCYLFGRATKSVSICPPTYYADIVCGRARCYLSGVFDMAIPPGSPALSEAAEGGHPEARKEDVLIHPYLRNTMFYI